MMPLWITNKTTLLNKASNNLLLITREDLKWPVEVLLPKPQTGKIFKVLQLSDHSITLNTNSPDYFFLWLGKHQKFAINGGSDLYGSNVTLTAFQGNWMLSTSFPSTNFLRE